jgi:hypothetical protein
MGLGWGCHAAFLVLHAIQHPGAYSRSRLIEGWMLMQLAVREEDKRLTIVTEYWQGTNVEISMAHSANAVNNQNGRSQWKNFGQSRSDFRVLPN